MFTFNIYFIWVHLLWKWIFTHLPQGPLLGPLSFGCCFSLPDNVHVNVWFYADVLLKCLSQCPLRIKWSLTYIWTYKQWTSCCFWKLRKESLFLLKSYFFLGVIKVIKVTSTHCTGHLTETAPCLFSHIPRGPMSHSSSVVILNCPLRTIQITTASLHFSNNINHVLPDMIWNRFCSPVITIEKIT